MRFDCIHCRKATTKPQSVKGAFLRMLTKQQIRGLYTIRINSYGEVYEADVVRSCGIQEWDNQVLEIIKDMPRWTPTINYYGKGEYRNSVWTTPIFFKKGEKTD